jgi:hypothetical protein
VGDACRGGRCLGGDVAPGCDPCAAITSLPASGGTFPGTLGGRAGQGGGGCGGAHGAERIYAWTPAVSGVATIHTCRSDPGAGVVLSVRGEECAAGDELGCDEDSGCEFLDDAGGGVSRPGARVTLEVQAGRTYHLVVAGRADHAQAFRLTVEAPRRCGNGVREPGEACDGADAAVCPGGCEVDCSCAGPPAPLPDLVPSVHDVSVEFAATVPPGDVAEGCAPRTTGLTLLRFAATMINQGQVDVQVGHPRCPNCRRNPGVVCGNPQFVCAPADGHNHPHFANQAMYELLDVGGAVVTRGRKQGFCLEDTSCPEGIRRKYTCGRQGLTAGCADTYHAKLGCQYIEVSDLPPGPYVLRVRLDPYGLIDELDETNNDVEVPVVIPAPVE